MIPPCNEPCVGSAPEPNIESVLPNAVIKERMVVGMWEKILEISRKKLDKSQLIRLGIQTDPQNLARASGAETSASDRRGERGCLSAALEETIIERTPSDPVGSS